MDRFDDDTLRAELRALRPKPRPEFSAELDERAAAGFPRRSSPYTSPVALVAAWWRDLSPRGRLLPAATVALVAVVVATTVIAAGGSGGGGNAAEDASLGMVTGGPSVEESAESSSVGAEGIEAGPNRVGHHHGGGGTVHAESSSETVYTPAVPSVGSGSHKSAGNAGAGGAGVESATAEGTGSAVKGVESVGPGHRDIERSASVVLGTKPGEVAGAAAKVYEAVHEADGVVLHSSVQSGRAGATGASFELLIPSAKLDDALAAFSAIAEVRERHDATDDITEPTVGAAEELADSNAAIEGLLKELADVETEAERESVEARLHEERRRHATIRASLDHLHERAAMSEVSVRIVTDHGAGVTPGESNSNGDWGVGDALHDAGHILTIAAGIVLIGLAVLVPIAAIALLIWAGNRFRVRRLRERTLG
jgi:Domain of unknown function (DUF4349)